jgi:hypothetical protein
MNSRALKTANELRDMIVEKLCSDTVRGLRE